MSDFNDLIIFIQKEINKSLKRLPIPDKPSYLYDPIRYSLKGGGKRLRPILVHLMGRAFNIDPDELMKIALSIELLHNFTLVHDDIMDKDTMRHGQKTIHTKWDTSSAILAGDGIYTIAQIILNTLSGIDNAVSSYFNKTTLEICEGQALDKKFENEPIITEKAYLNMIEKKTGALLSAAAALPVIYNGESQSFINYCDSFGRYLGNGFQIQDDLLEITSDEKTMGKSLESDIYKCKKTIMVIKAHNRYPQKWDKLISNSSKNNIKNNIHSFFDETGIIKETKFSAEFYFNSSREAIKKLKIHNKNELLQFVDLIEKRTY